MNQQEVAVLEQSRALVEESMTAGVLSEKHVQARINMIQSAIKGIFKEGVHFGKIPGTDKPTLYQPGADQLLVMFRIAANEPKIEDLSTADSVRYRVTVGGTAQANGTFLGAGAGECSSDEEKYRWRRPVCDDEFNETPEDRRRQVWKRFSKNEAPKKVNQIRTNHADVANTVLKMAVKRAKIAMTLVVTGAADAFNQDLEDLSDEVREGVLEGERPAAAPPARASAPPPAAPPAGAPAGELKPAGRKISEKQAGRFYAICASAKKTREQGDAYLSEVWSVPKAEDLDVAFYDQACQWAASR